MVCTTSRRDGTEEVMNRIVAVGVGLTLAMTIFAFPSLRSLADANNPFSDFAAFYTAAKMDWDALYDLNRQYDVQRGFAPAPAERMAYYFYPPFFAAFLRPLALLSYKQAFAATIALDLLLLGFALRTLIRNLNLDSAQGGWLIFLTLINFGVYFCLLKGQTSFISLTLLVLYVVALIDCEKTLASQYPAGIWAALLCFKPPLAIVPVFVLLVKRKWKALIAFSVTMVALGVISLAMVGWSGMLEYLEISKQVGTGAAMDYAHSHHNLRAVIYFFAAPVLRDFIWVGATLLLFAVITVYARRSSSDAKAWAVILVSSLLVDPYLHFYDLTLLIVPTAFLLKWPADLLPPVLALGLIALDMLFMVHASTGIAPVTAVPLLGLVIWMVAWEKGRPEQAETERDT